MKQESPKKSEIFLLLALRQAERQDLSAAEHKKTDSSDDFLSAFSGQMSAPEVREIEQFRRVYLEKTAKEKQIWREQIKNYIASDEMTVDANIHWSHIESALRNEIGAIQKIVVSGLCAGQQKHFTKTQNTPENVQSKHFKLIEKTVRKTFAAQFVALYNLPSASFFDRLSGAQTARLARQAGIREVALACLRIPAVESVAAFLRRFSAEDARAIAAQMSGLPEIHDARLSFAENLVQSAMESEPKPSAMLDLLGIRLIATLLCGANFKRITYTAQKLPLEFTPQFSDLIEAQQRTAPAELQREISAEIERLAETVVNMFEKAE